MSQECPERRRLCQQVIAATNAVYSIRDGKSQGRDAALKLGDARSTLRDATRALDRHLTEHGCKSPEELTYLKRAYPR